MLEDLQTYFKVTYQSTDTIFPQLSIQEFKDTSFYTYDKIHKDCIRSCQLARNEYKSANPLQIQAVFESYFIHILSLSPVKSSHYFQGLTDIFEIIFLSFLTTTNLPVIPHTETDYEPLDIPLSLFFSDTNFLMHVSTQILTDYYNVTGFSVDFFTAQCLETTDFIKKFDPELSKLFREFQPEILLKFQFSMGLRYAGSLKVAELVLLRFLQFPTMRSLMVQQLVSVCFRAYVQGIPGKKYQLNLMTKKMVPRSAYCVMEAVTNAFPEVYGVDQNVEIIDQVLAEAVTMLEKSNQTKAIAIGIGIGMSLFGVVGGVVGGILAQQWHDKRK